MSTKKAPAPVQVMIFGEEYQIRTDLGEAGFANAGDMYRFATERSLSVDTTASGGNASLFSIEDEAEA